MIFLFLLIFTTSSAISGLLWLIRLLLLFSSFVAISLLLDIDLMRPLNDIIPTAADLDRRILRIGILFDLVAAMTNDGGLAFLYDLADLAARTTTRPLPRDCLRARTELAGV